MNNLVKYKKGIIFCLLKAPTDFLHSLYRRFVLKKSASAVTDRQTTVGLCYTIFFKGFAWSCFALNFSPSFPPERIGEAMYLI